MMEIDEFKEAWKIFDAASDDDIRVDVYDY